MRRHEDRPRPPQESRLQRRLGHAAVRPEGRAGRQRRLPRLLDHGLHFSRSPSRHECRLRRLRRVRAPARNQGLPRRGREPHGRRDPAFRLRVLRRPVPRLPGQGVQPRALRDRQDLPVPEDLEHAASAVRPRSRSEREEAGLAERPTPLPQPRRHRLLRLQRALLRAGRLLRARRSLHGAARGRERAGQGVRRLDHALQGRRLPHRHREARQRCVLPASGRRRSSPRRRPQACPTSSSSAR